MTVKSRLQELGFRYGKNTPTGTYGIEIETEVKDWSHYDEAIKRSGGTIHEEFLIQMSDGRYKIIGLDEWEGHVDNSLRNIGMEYVLKKPLDFSAAKSALKKFDKVMKGVKFVQKSPSTSVHVHINMLEESPIVLMNFLTAYSLFENILVDYSGEHRRSNLFALPIRVAEQTAFNICRLARMIKDQKLDIAIFDESQVKYAAINIAPLSKFGSVEIRSFRGETDVNEIEDWIGIVDCIFRYSKTPGLTPRIILFEYKAKGIELFNEVFSAYADKISARVNEISTLMERNVFYVYKIASTIKDWMTFEEVQKEERKEKTKFGIAPEMVLYDDSGYPGTTAATTEPTLPDFHIDQMLGQLNQAIPEGDEDDIDL